MSPGGRTPLHPHLDTGRGGPPGGCPGPQARGSLQAQPVGACPAREGRPPAPGMITRPRALILKGPPPGCRGRSLARQVGPGALFVPAP